MNSETGGDVTQAIKERRFKVVSMDPRLFVDMLNWWRNPPDFVSLPILEGLPEDCVAVSVSGSWHRNLIEVIVASASFPPCQNGAYPEQIPGLITEFRHIAFSELIQSKGNQ